MQACYLFTSLPIISIIIARKRNLVQGNVFTLVCHSVHRGRWVYPTPLDRPPSPLDAGHPPPDADPLFPLDADPPLGCRSPLDADPPYGQQAGGTLPTGMYTCSFLPTPQFIYNAWQYYPRTGELASAIRNNTDIHFGLYHSLFEWFNPMYLQDKANNFKTRNFPQVWDI